MKRLLSLVLASVVVVTPVSAQVKNAPLDVEASLTVLRFLSALDRSEDETRYLADDAKFTWLGVGGGYDAKQFKLLADSCELVALYGSQPVEVGDTNDYLWAAFECEESDERNSRLLLGFAISSEKIFQVEMDLFTGLGGETAPGICEPTGESDNG